MRPLRTALPFYSLNITGQYIDQRKVDNLLAKLTNLRVHLISKINYKRTDVVAYF